MEWVETTGRTLEEAKEAALDQLGVDEVDAEFEVVEEPKSGLFGRLRTEARVRARVRPTSPRPKVERGDRRRRGGRGGDERAEPRNDGRQRAAVEERDVSEAPATAIRSQDPTDDLEVVAEDLRRYLEGLVERFGLTASVSVAIDGDERVVEAAVDGDELGLLVGPKGTTLQAIQELARSSVSHGSSTRLRVDVASYRARRSEALARFARSVGDQVLQRGEPTSLEPMGAADRKVVHDTINAMEGLRTVSEGEDDRRHVVILPE